MLAANETLSAQDQRIAGQVALHRKAVVVLLNKADLVKGTTMGLQENIREQLKFMPYAVVQPISVMTGWHLDKIGPSDRGLSVLYHPPGDPCLKSADSGGDSSESAAD